MVIENFTNRLLTSRFIDTYVATAFFGTLIFFIVNAHVFTPFEMIFGVIAVTIGFKGLAHFITALVISLHNSDNKKNELEFDEKASKIDGLLNDLALQQTKLKTHNE